MTLYEIIIRFNNIKLLDSENIPKDLLKVAIQSVIDELIEKITNIIDYRKSLIQEQKTSKLIELDEYIQYCLLIGEIDKIETEIFSLEVIKPTENINFQKEVIILKEFGENENKRNGID